MNLDDIIAEPPLVHKDGAGVFAINPAVLRFIHGRLTPDAHTVETGLGASTAMFAAAGAHHLCITPSEHEAARLRDYCAEKDLDLSRVRFELRGSQHVLPALADESFDVALIDGGHGFPLPFIDWFYMAERLKPGGLLIIDDTQLWTGAVLVDFLKREPGWRLLKTFSGSAAFEMTAPFNYAEWCDQPYVADKSRLSRRLCDARNAAGMIRRGEWRRFRRRLANAFTP